jgi:hypothetical protein
VPSENPTPAPTPNPTVAPTSSSPSESPTNEPTSTLLPGSGVCAVGYAVHAGSAITFADTTVSGGDVGVFPDGTNPITDITGEYEIVHGILDNTVDFAPSVDHAWNAALALRDDAMVIATEIGGITFTPGTRRSGTFNIAAGATVTLDGQGDSNSVFLFQAVSTMVTGAGCRIVLTGGAKQENVLWALGTALTTGANNVFRGSILAGSAITFGADNEVYGSVVARTAITFGARNKVYGCVVALTAITFVVHNSVQCITCGDM